MGKRRCAAILGKREEEPAILQALACVFLQMRVPEQITSRVVCVVAMPHFRAALWRQHPVLVSAPAPPDSLSRPLCASTNHSHEVSTEQLIIAQMWGTNEYKDLKLKRIMYGVQQ